VEDVSLSQFGHGWPIWIRLRESIGLDGHEVARRARSRLGEDRYHVFTNNCEHFCQWCLRGEHRSYQVEELARRYRRIRQRVMQPLSRALLRVWRAVALGHAAGSHAGTN